MYRIADQVTFVVGFLGNLQCTRLCLDRLVVFLFSDRTALIHLQKHFVTLLLRCLRMGDRIISGRRIGQTDQHRRLRRLQIRRFLVKVILAGRCHTVTAVSVIVAVTVKLHDLILAKLLLHRRCEQNLRNLSRKGLLLRQQIVLDHLLGNGTSALRDLSAVLKQCHTGTHCR